MTSRVGRIVDGLWLALAASLIAAGAVVSLIRLLLPQIGAQRTTIEAWISDVVGRPVAVGEIGASWHGWSPRLQVSRIAILAPDGKVELVHFDGAAIDISPWGSLMARGLKPRRLALHGVAMTVIRDQAGHFSIAGMPAPKAPVVRWLLEQDNFDVRDAELTVIDERSRSSYALTGVKVSVHSHATQKIVTAYAGLPSALGRRIAFELTSAGPPLDAHWNGTLNVRFEGLRSAALARQFDWRGAAPPDVPLDVIAWSSWRRGRLQQADFNFTATDDADKVLLSARGRAVRENQAWQIALADIAMPASATERGRMRLWWSGEGGRVVARGTDLPLEPLATVVAQGLALDDARRAELLRAQPRGRVASFAVAWRAARTDEVQDYFVAAELRDCALAGGAHLPNLTASALAIAANRHSGALQFDHSRLHITAPELFVEPLVIDELSGALGWSRAAADGLQLHAQQLAGTVIGTQVALNGVLAWPRAGAPSADLNAQFATRDAKRFHALLPRGMLPVNGEAWARRVVQAGRIDNGRLALAGPLDKLPFRTGEGRLAFEFELAEADLLYARDWPLARGLAGKVALHNAAASLAVSAGRVSGADVSGARIAMADVTSRERSVQINGTARGPGTSAAEFVMTSPLKHGRAARLSEIDIAGELEIELELDLGLYPGGTRDVLGLARLAGNRITSRRHGVELDDVRGEISFTPGEWYGEALSARFDGTPVGLVVAGGLDDPNYDSEFRMTGVSQAGQLGAYLTRYARPLFEWLDQRQKLSAFSGEIPWKAVLTVPSEAEDDASLPHRLTLESSLVGLAVDLPWPFGKQAAERRALRIVSELDERIPRTTRIDLGDRLSVEIELARHADKRPELQRAEVIFGSLQPEFRARPGVSMHGYIPQLEVDEWAALVGRARNAGAGARNLPVSFDVQVTNLRMLGRGFRDVRVRGARDANAWQASLTGDSIDGSVSLPRKLEQAKLELNFERLHLAAGPPAAGTAPAPALDLDPRRVPTFALRCADFRYGDIALGQAEIDASHHVEGLQLDRIAFTAEDVKIEAQGDWLVQDAAQRSRFNIGVNSRSLAQLLQRFGFQFANVKHGRTAIAIEARWPGTPVDFALARMDGSFEIDVVDGRFLDIEPGTGRLFGLLSLQTLPRRLLLDFEDLFEKGFTFDRIAGVFELENGNAYTNSLLMEGPAARVDITGRTGLADKDYDQQVVVTPALSNTLPLAGALFGPIGAGAGAVYYIGGRMFKALPEQINKFLSRKYSVTGSWDNPVIERI